MDDHEHNHHLHIGLELTSAVVKLILTVNDIIKKLLTPRSVYTSMFFGVLCYLILKQLPIPQLLNSICSSLFGFWFGEQSAKRQMEVMKNGNKEYKEVS